MFFAFLSSFTILYSVAGARCTAKLQKPCAGWMLAHMSPCFKWIWLFSVPLYSFMWVLSLGWEVVSHKNCSHAWFQGCLKCLHLVVPLYIESTCIVHICPFKDTNVKYSWKYLVPDMLWHTEGPEHSGMGTASTHWIWLLPETHMFWHILCCSQLCPWGAPRTQWCNFPCWALSSHI